MTSSVRLNVRALMLFALGYAGLLTALAFCLPEDQFRWMFSEQGPFERMSIVFWLSLAALCLFLPGLPYQGRFAPALAALLAAGREADLHRAFTERSIFKSSYYLKSAAPLGEKVLGGLVAFLALVVYLLGAGARYFFRARAWQRGWAQTLASGVGLLAICKMMDRAESVLGEWFGWRFAPVLKHLNGAWEEGFECLLPVLFIVGVLQYRAWRQSKRDPVG